MYFWRRIAKTKFFFCRYFCFSYTKRKKRLDRYIHHRLISLLLSLLLLFLTKCIMIICEKKREPHYLKCIKSQTYNNDTNSQEKKLNLTNIKTTKKTVIFFNFQMVDNHHHHHHPSSFWI